MSENLNIQARETSEHFQHPNIICCWVKGLHVVSKEAMVLP